MSIEDELKNFLEDNNISCDSCIYYNENMKKPEVKEQYCMKNENSQMTMHGRKYFWPDNKNFMCKGYKSK